jgi:hypothetical protein
MTEAVSVACPVCDQHRPGSPVHANWCVDCGELMQVVDGPFRDGRIFVLDAKCSTCIFRPGNLMHLAEGRVEQMVEACIENQSAIPCHKTLDGPRSICRGFWDVHRDEVWTLRLAMAMNMIEFDSVPDQG